MKTRIASFALVALLALAGPVMAQAPGTADPLGPITVGAVVPFFGAAVLKVDVQDGTIQNIRRKVERIER